MLLSCYYIGDRLSEQDKNAIMIEARTAYMKYRQMYRNVHSVLIHDILEIHGTEDEENGLSGHSREDNSLGSAWAYAAYATDEAN